MLALCLQASNDADTAASVYSSMQGWQAVAIALQSLWSQASIPYTAATAACPKATELGSGLRLGSVSEAGLGSE